MSEAIQRKLHDMLEKSVKYGVNDGWTDGYELGTSIALRLMVAEDGVNYTGCESFDRDIKGHGNAIESMAARDTRIRREALAATDEELAIMEAAFDDAIEEREDDGVGAMGIAMKALAESRERES